MQPSVHEARERLKYAPSVAHRTKPSGHAMAGPKLKQRGPLLMRCENVNALGCHR